MFWRLRFLSVVIFTAFVFVSCRGHQEMRESAGRYSIFDPSHVPYVVVAKVLESGTPAGRVTRSPRTGRHIQVWKARLEIENVLQGNLPLGPIDIFYLLHDDIPGSLSRLVLTKNERDVLFLERDGSILRPICDAARNCCARKVLTGAHPNFVRPPKMTIEQAITEVELTRGLGPNGKPIDDRQMLLAIRSFRPISNQHDQDVLATLTKLEATEPPLVGEAVCAALLQFHQHCGEDEQSGPTPDRPAIQVGRSEKDKTYRPAKRIRITITGAPQQPVYKHTSAGSQQWSVRVGRTDAAGRFSREEITPAGNTTQTEIWSVGTREASPALTYTALNSTGQGQVITTPVANPRDRYGLAVSAMSALGQNVFGYFVIDLSYPAGLYYDVRSAATLFQEQETAQTASPSGTISVAGLLKIPAVPMKDYTIVARSYLVPMSVNRSFVNPLGFGDGSCFGANDDCQIVPIAGPKNLSEPVLRLGTTVANQTSVPQNPDYWLRGSDRDSKRRVLDSLLKTGNPDEAWTIAVVKVVSALQEFPPDLISAKM